MMSRLSVVIGIFLLVSVSVPGESLAEQTSRNTAFALDLYAQLAGGEGNIFFSPYSISTALAMTYAGARGLTREEMAAALHFPLDQQKLHAACAELQQHLLRIQKMRAAQLNIANALWIQEDYQLDPEFTRLNEKFFGAHLYSLDFKRDPERSRLSINDWVEDETEGRIQDLLAPGIIKELTRLVLTNAIYFMAEWMRPFEPRNTKPDDFWLSQERSVKVPMMQQKAAFAYGETEDLKILEMPYQRGALSMLVLLPKTIDGLSRMEAQLNLDSLQGWTSRLNRREVRVYFPKFRFEGDFMLNQALEALGMKAAFSRDADFSGIEPKKELYISAVIHKAFVDVDEFGTEAAAATAVALMEKVSLPVAPPQEFKADHPFLFLIRDNQTGSILFIGRLNRP